MENLPEEIVTEFYSYLDPEINIKRYSNLQI